MLPLINSDTDIMPLVKAGISPPNENSMSLNVGITFTTSKIITPNIRSDKIIGYDKAALTFSLISISFSIESAI